MSIERATALVLLACCVGVCSGCCLGGGAASSSRPLPTPAAAAVPVPSPPPPLVALTGDELAETCRTADAAIGRAERALRRNDYPTAWQALIEARPVVDRLSGSEDARSIAVLNRYDEAAAPLAGMDEAIGVLISAADALSASSHPDPLERYEAVIAANRAAHQLQQRPALLSRDLERAQAALERAESRLEEQTFDARISRTVETRGLLRVTARQLADEFRDNEVLAERTYRGRRLAVDGTVSEVSSGMLGGAQVHLRTSNRFMPVIAQTDTQSGGRFHRGDRVLLDCTGGSMVMGSPVLRNCEWLAHWH